ncbi:ABC transporter permease subunit [Plantactinospora mayteni]|uniref:ABC nitrate/sulfonate/bicarbonate family protein transporter inner membrane subunit n=1 Tax=Plantactinospora mayteni TaxID=566021 RepID=A0ABQ4F1E1_9ACTN|nr:ABC transporter permease [Plantactinospora mayteni]GIH00727.1 ABC nitrate/sulfonate/bicarbonate family protein transporter inner membrane subunit [Plantactinospora mayteni]
MSATDTRRDTGPADTAAPDTVDELPRRRRSHPVVRVLRSSLAGRIAFPIVCLLVWLLAIRIVTSIWPFAVDVLPTPTQVFSFMWDELTGETLAPRNVYETFGISLRRLGIGMAIAMAIGTVIGLGMGLSKRVNAFFNDWVVAILAMPNLAWALFCSLAFGFGDVGPIVTVVLTGIPFVIINVREGVRNAPTDLYDMARAFGVSRADTIRHVLLPSLMPFMFAAARYAFALGWKGLVVAEVFGGEDGAGWTIKFWYDAHRAYGVIGYALLFVVFALLFEKFLFDRLSGYFFRWRPEVNAADVVEQRFDAPGVATATATADSGNGTHATTTGPKPERGAGGDETRRSHDG